MSKDKDRNDNTDEPNIYPSDYIDYTPQSYKRNRSISSFKIMLITVIISTIFVFSLIFFKPLYFISYPKLGDMPNAIQKISKKAESLSDELNVLAVQLGKIAREGKTQIDRDKLINILEIEIQLKNSVCNLQKVKKNLDLESNHLENILQGTNLRSGNMYSKDFCS